MSTFYFRAEQSTYVQSNRPGLISCRSPHLPVGIWHNLGEGFSCEYTSYIFFDISPIPKFLVVESAIMTLYFASPPLRGNPPESINIQALGSRFQDCLTNYDIRPPSYPSTALTVPLPPRFTSLVVDLTHLVQQWHSGILTNKGLALLPSQPSGHGVLVFASSSHLDWTLHPVLVIHADRDPKCHTVNFEEQHRVDIKENYSQIRQVWCYSAYSFIVKNTGLKKILVTLQDSADGNNFFDEEPEYEFLPGASEVLVNRYFTRFSRLKFRLAPGETGSGRIRVWLQGRQE